MEHNYCPHCMHLNQPDAIQCSRCHNNMRIENQTHMLPIGTVLHDRYLIGKCIGQGGAGITYIGLDQVLKRPVAIKEYYPDSIAKRNNTLSIQVLTHSDEETSGWYEKFKERFLEEARILAGFAGNPNLVYVSDLFEENETAYFIMEYVDGVSLHEWLKTRDKVSFDEAYSMLMPVIKTIGDINDQGLIHRDISPSNIMITKAGNTKLLDFGAAREYTNAGEKSISIVLKPGYAPQEQYNTRGKQGPWTDVYALCATIYKMITGQIPENALNRMFEDDLAVPSELGAEIKPEQEAVLMKGLAVRPKDRIQTMDELFTEFEKANAKKGFEGTKIEVEEEDDDEKTLMGPIHKPASETKESTPEKLIIENERIQEKKPVRRTLEEPAEIRQDQPAFETTTSQKAIDNKTKSTEEKPKKTDKKTDRQSKNRDKKADQQSGKKNFGKLFAIIAAALVVVALIAVVILPKEDKYSKSKKEVGIWRISNLTSGGKSATALDVTVTADDMKQVEDCSHLYMTKCQLQQDAVDYMGDKLKARVIDLQECKGFDTLDPLAKIEELETIYLNGMENSITIENTCFTTAFPSVKQLYIGNAILKDGGQFLSNFTGLTYMSLRNLYQFKGLPELSSDLQTLSLDQIDCASADLTEMKNCQNLAYLTLKECNLSDISFLSMMKKLYSLNLDQNKLTSLEDLSGLPIRQLSANANQLTNLHGLENNEELKSLHVAMNQLTDLSALANDTELTEVDLGKNQLTDISSLAGAVNMRTLKLYKNQLTDINPIKGMKDMKQLVINENAFQNLDACNELIKLEEVIASHNQLTSIDGLSNCTVLDRVSFAGNMLTDASVLGKSAEKLTVVCLEDNQLTDISFLHGAEALETLTIHNNAITSLNGLEESKNLKAISAHHNAITNINGLAGSNVLYYADLGDNEIADISAVSQKEAAKRVLVLNNNKVTDISSLRTDTKYVALALHGNNITDSGVLDNLIGQKGDEEISFEWNGDIHMLDSAASAYNGYRVDVVNVPLDQQVKLNTAFEEKYKELHPEKHLAYEIKFYTTEQMEAHLEELREDTIKVDMEDLYEYSTEE